MSSLVTFNVFILIIPLYWFTSRHRVPVATSPGLLKYVMYLKERYFKIVLPGIFQIYRYHSSLFTYFTNQWVLTCNIL